MGMSILKILVVVLVIIGLTIAGLYYTGSKKEGFVLKAEIQIKGSVRGNETIAEIGNITANIEPYSKVSLPKMTGLYAPSVMVVVLRGSQMIGSWTSAPYTGTGIYNLTIGLGANPNPGDTLIVDVRVIDKKGNNIAIKNKEIRYE
jgi:FAD synthase